MVMQQYEPLETLAPALFGNVQKWRHTSSGEYVAVKRMELRFAARKRSKSSERVVEEDLFTEIKTNLRVQSLGGHPNVLPLRDCIMEDEAVLLVLKFCERGELLDVVNTQRAAGKQVNVMHYFAQILRGAAFLHANDIAHRDLSLENVLVDERDCCQITDFGLATQCKGKITVRPVGKLRYMAPEVSAAMVYEEGHQNEYDPMVADVWALGVMLYAMVAARYPFREPLRKDDRFRLLEDFGVEYLLEKDEVDVEGKERVVDLLKRLLVVNPTERSTLAELLSHPALPVVGGNETRPACLTKEERPEHSLEQVTVASNDDTRQRARSLGRFNGKGSLASVSPNAPLSEAEKNKQALASSAIKTTAVVSAPVTGNNGCAGGRLLRKCFATRA
ncbi:protein kinase, putative [Phytophthora infestans T30-4]|uniref:Protein kinase, putative n=2 Tax=Phytophthora infestans TaxID=4787 RepID=D0MWN2_PHYIT|nr:protein kinase, putative [Phytophthora infestans T30-4]EEY64045.1 protein kinase, putative [Phytophthora infestans T30-4]KAF4140975.1 Protein kinase domain [Phytophthora infestans]|eukprot:XP_002907481.1 protein kinase, putative [Phytophthora infestans T30-4]